MHGSKCRVAALVAAAAVVIVAGCQKQAEPQAAAPSAEPNYIATATIKDLMQSVVDTSADDKTVRVVPIKSAAARESLQEALSRMFAKPE